MLGIIPCIGLELKHSPGRRISFKVVKTWRPGISYEQLNPLHGLHNYMPTVIVSDLFSGKAGVAK